MKKKIVSLLAILLIVLASATEFGFAQSSKKVIFISMDKTNLLNMQKISVVNKKLDTSGYVAHMNIRGDKGTTDSRSYASMGAGGRVNVTRDDDVINFRDATPENSMLFKSATGKKAKGVNYVGVNKSINENMDNSEYGSTLGVMGQTLSDNKLKTAVIGNSDIYDNDGKLILNRNLCLTAMDESGRIDMGNVDNINKKDATMPFGISTDYKKLIKETQKYYKESDVLFVDLGDTYRLDMYKKNLNETTLENQRDRINDRINTYLKEVFKMVGKDDVVYITSGFPSEIDYKNKRRLSPIIKFKGDGKGVITSATTRQEGILANLDVGVDILNEFGLKNEKMVGRPYKLVERADNIEYIMGEYEKQVSISTIRGTIINTFVIVVSVSWILAMIAILFRNCFHKYKEKIFKLLKELIKLGIIMPLSFMLATVMNCKQPMTILITIFAVAALLYVFGAIFIKDDIKNMGFFAGITILIITVDSMFGTYMMKNNIMSYDAIVGARYYGVGNEYEGVTIGSALFALAVLLNFKKVPKWSVVLVSFIILITSAYPSMGANVGGAISESIAYLLFILLIYDVKIDFKKILLLGFTAVAVVAVFAFLDIRSGSSSHLGAFVIKIFENGPSEVIMTFARKISMNVKIAKTSVWVNILLAGVAILAVLMFRPSKHFLALTKEYPIIFKGFIASIVGCIISLLVNDSGIVAAATSSIYVLIPIVVISINMIIFKQTGPGHIEG
ncbi:MAG: hypothetical protein LBN09_03855 [Clostridioides sp.]|jgi:hypothetical protein|nr:hypothetical protein [Clostridioides sp.]